MGDHVALSQRGKDYWGLCPFHPERTPSFTVSSAKGLFYCFGCGKGGDAITFLRELRGVDYGPLMLELAERYAVSVEYDHANEDSVDRSAVCESLRIVLRYATDYYHSRLLGQAGRRGMDYLTKRGVQTNTLVHYTIGYADDAWDIFYKRATKDAHGAAMLTQSGLCKEKRGGLYDVLRDRVVFPILDVMGRVVAFGGRALGAQLPKYLNLGETPLYKKGEHVYGLYQAREAVRQHGFIYLVEGYMDVLSVQQTGIAHVAAPLGTALTGSQARLLRRYTERVVLLFDGDAAGITAVLRSVDVLLATELEVAIVPLPEGMDPDEYITKEGPSIFKRYLKTNEQHFIPFMLNTLGMRRSSTLRETGDVSVSVVRQVLRSIVKSPSPLVREALVGVCAEQTSFSSLVLAEELAILLGTSSKASRFGRLTKNTEGASSPVAATFQRQEQEALVFLLRHGETIVDKQGSRLSVCEHIMRATADVSFTEGQHGRMLAKIKEQVATDKWHGHKYFVQHGSEEEKKIVASALMTLPKLSPRWVEKTGATETLTPSETLMLADKIVARLQERRVDYARRMLFDADDEEHAHTGEAINAYMKQKEKQRMATATTTSRLTAFYGEPKEKAHGKSSTK